MRAQEEDLTRSTVRWGGAALAAGSLLYIAAIVLYVVLLGQPEGTGPGGAVTLSDTAAMYAEKWHLLAPAWTLELLAGVVLGMAGFSLQSRDVPGAAWLPARTAWIAVGVGAMIGAVALAVVLGTYPPALAARNQQLELFATVRGGFGAVFNMSTSLILVGFAGAFIAEGSPAGVLPRWLGRAGGILAIVTAVATVLSVLFDQLAASAPLALLVFLLAGYVGVSIWRGERRARDDFPRES